MNIDWLHLKQLSKMKTPEDINEFEKKIWTLAQTKNINVLTHLIDLFDDNCLYYEVMYSLVHAIETYNKNDYVNAVIKKIHDGIKNYKFWIDCLCNRIFNDLSYLAIFRQNMHLADKESLLKLFKIMEEESPHHRQLIQELRKEIETSSKD